MSKSSFVLAKRDLGQFPLSVGTSLAIESLANLVPDRPKVHPVPIKQIDVLLVNLRTLYRNMVTGIKAHDREALRPRDIADYLAEETVQCRAAVSKISDHKVETYFYLCRYPDLAKRFPKAFIIRPNTLKQQLAKDMEDATLRLVEEAPARFGDPKLFDYLPEGGGLNNDRVAMLTHLPLDLTSRYEFRELFLLESNTGAFKAPREFSSKLKVKPEGVYFPFNVFTLQVLGDGGKLFAPQDTEVLKVMIELAQKNRWTHMTTREKIQHSLANAGSAPVIGFLKDLLHAR